MKQREWNNTFITAEDRDMDKRLIGMKRERERRKERK